MNLILIFACVVVVTGAVLFGLHMMIKHWQADYHNSELDSLLARMDVWETQKTQILSGVEQLNGEIGKFKTMLSLSKRNGQQ